MTMMIDPQTERLAAEIAELTGDSQAEAVRKALEEKRQRLAPAADPEALVARWKQYLEEKVWPQVRPEFRGRRISKEERERILGVGPDGV
jgi:antitoxin VapB